MKEIKKVKPILVIKIPYNGYNAHKHEDQIEIIKKELAEDYYVIALCESKVNQVVFELYNTSITETDYEELKQIVLTSLAEIKV